MILPKSPLPVSIFVCASAACSKVYSESTIDFIFFCPTKTELEWASKVCEAYEKSTRETGRGAVTIDGKMIDEVHYKRAIKVLQTS